MFLSSKDQDVIKHYESAIAWVKKNSLPEEGVSYSNVRRVPYLEVTGYLIPTLLDAGENVLALQYADFLSWIQHPDGAFTGIDGKKYIFDTAQALRGLSAAARLHSRFLPSVRRAADFIVSAMRSDGQMAPSYGDDIPEAVHVYALPALEAAADVLGEKKYSIAARHALSFYYARKDVLPISVLTHFSGYIVDGFLEMGEARFVDPFIENMLKLQDRKGSIVGIPGVSKWVCSPGLAQWAIIASKTGRHLHAGLAVRELCRLQNVSGGFYGSYGSKANYFKNEEIPWAVKFFLDAVHMRARLSCSDASDQLNLDDARLLVLRDGMTLRSSRVLDAGCGNGRFSKALKEFSVECDFHGCDVSSDILAAAPEFMTKTQGTLLSLPYTDGHFSAAFCVETMEHVLRLPLAIREICRVVGDGGKILIIDKNSKKNRKASQWFDSDVITKELKKYCVDVVVNPLRFDGRFDDGLFLCWSAVRASCLKENSWHDVITDGLIPEDVIKDVRAHHFPSWVQPLLEHTKAGDAVLELGSGTGLLSAVLASYERRAHLMDFSAESLVFAKEVFSALGLNGDFYEQDIRHDWQMKNDQVDYVFSSGVLEHFSDEDIVAILKRSLAVSRKGIMSLVPNAHSLSYLAGKMKLEKDGRWRYGRETPKKSLRPLFEKAGAIDIVEYSVSPYQALKFLGDQCGVFKDLLDGMGQQEKQGLDQGYLIFTYGKKKI